MNLTLETKKDVIEAAKQLVKKGAKHAIISMGGKGSVYADKDNILYASPIKGKVLNTVGAGDSMVAGFIDGYKKSFNPIKRFKQSVACGSATAFDYGLAKKKAIDEVMEKIEIKRED